jgi:hypothetical protein
MSLFFPKEIETEVDGSEGYIYIRQERDDGRLDIIQLTIHQFNEIFNRSKHVIADARGENELAKV